MQRLSSEWLCDLFQYFVDIRFLFKQEFGHFDEIFNNDVFELFELEIGFRQFHGVQMTTTSIDICRPLHQSKYITQLVCTMLPKVGPMGQNRVLLGGTFSVTTGDLVQLDHCLALLYLLDTWSNLFSRCSYSLSGRDWSHMLDV